MKVFDDHLEGLVQTIKVANANYCIWKIYKNVHDRNEYISIYNNFLDFFKTSIHSHFVAMLMAIYKLYDSNKDSISIKKLLIEAEQLDGMSRTVILSAENKMKITLPLWEKAKKLRHKLFAHRDRLLSYESVFKDADIRVEDFGTIIEGSLHILNEISRHQYRKTYHLSKSATVDTYKLFDFLKENIGKTT